MTDEQVRHVFEQNALKQKRKAKKMVFIVLGCVAGFVLIIITVVMRVMLSSDAYKIATKEISRNKEVEKATGGVEDIGWPTGNISTENDSGEAYFDISVNGKTKDIDVYIHIHKQSGHDWEVVDLTIY